MKTKSSARKKNKALATDGGGRGKKKNAALKMKSKTPAKGPKGVDGGGKGGKKTDKGGKPAKPKSKAPVRAMRAGSTAGRKGLAPAASDGGGKGRARLAEVDQGSGVVASPVLLPRASGTEPATVPSEAAGELVAAGSTEAPVPLATDGGGRG